jgi:hypothetical protein
MRAAGLTRYKWRFDHGAALFEVIFIVEDNPWEILLGAIDKDFAIVLPVRPPFQIQTDLSREEYRALCKALELTYDPNHPFRPASFFAHLNDNAPQVVEPMLGRVRPQDVLYYRRDVEECDKIYFCGWRDNTARGETVSPGNLEKTRQAFGPTISKFCEQRNISSRWTDNQILARDYFAPDV